LFVRFLAMASKFCMGFDVTCDTQSLKIVA
jgi:hypothetical protein